MSRLAIFILLFVVMMLFPNVLSSQSLRNANGKLMAKIENGEIRDPSSLKMGRVSMNGEVRDRSGKKFGVIKDGRVVNANSQTICKYDSGTVRDNNGRLIYRITSDTVRNASGQLLLKYEEIGLTDLLAFLCFFYAEN